MPANARPLVIGPAVRQWLPTGRPGGEGPKLEIGWAVFCCVDQIEARGVIWRTVRHRAEFWGDGRMLGETMRILVAADEASRAYYPTTLFDAREAEQGSCTARSTVYTANVAAGLLIHQFVRWLRRQPTDQDLTLNLLASELVFGSSTTGLQQV